MRIGRLLVFVENLLGLAINLDNEGFGTTSWFVANLPERGTGLDELTTGGGEVATKVWWAVSGGDAYSLGQVEAELAGCGWLVKGWDVVIWSDIDLLVNESEILIGFREDVEIAFVGLGLAEPVFGDGCSWVFDTGDGNHD